MSRSDLHPDIDAEYDATNRGWRIWIPMSHVEEQAHRQGIRFTGPMPSYEGLKREGVKMGETIAEALGRPGPIQRECRAQVKKNNRRRFGP